MMKTAKYGTMSQDEQGSLEAGSQVLRGGLCGIPSLKMSDLHAEVAFIAFLG
jgi:hypothetical protein